MKTLLKYRRFFMALVILTGVFLSIRAVLAEDITWSQINTDGFGDANNHEAYGSVVFNDQLYIGTSNDVTGGEVWRYNGTAWTQVNTDGFGDANSWYVYELFEFNDLLYAGVGNETTGIEVWRYNGTAWSQINNDGFGDANNTVGWSASMIEYNSNLYLGVSNWITGAEVWRYNGTVWTQVNTDGFGDANNSDIFDMIILDNNLYAGTLNTITGAEVWRYNETTWTQINTDGFGDANNIGVLEMAVYDNTLCTGGWNVTTGSELWAYSGSAWSQINADGYGDANNISSLSMAVYYDLLHIGTTNTTSGSEVWQYNGTSLAQVNTGGYGEGADNRSTGSLVVYDNKLYAGVRNLTTGVEIWQGEIPDLTDPAITNRRPVNEATGIIKNKNISFELNDDVWGVNSDSIDVTIEGEDVIVNGVFQTGFSGTITSDGDKGYDVTINPDSNFSLGQVVNITVSFADYLGNSTSSSWSFTVNTAPAATGKSPANGAVDVEKDTDIFFEIGDSEGTVNRDSIDFLIEGVNAIETGTSAPGFANSITSDGEGGFDITVNPDDDFSVNQEVNLELNVCDDKNDCSTTTWSFITVTEPVSLGIVMTPASLGGPNVRVVDENGTQISSFFAYDENLRMGLMVEQADIDGDSINEIIITPGEGVESTIKAFELDGTEIASTLAFNVGFTGGVSLACGDFDGDGKDDITVTPTSAGGPNIRTYSLNSAGNAFVLKDWFFAYDENFRGGINLAAGDIDGDGVDDLVVAPRGSGGPNVRVYQYNTASSEFEVLDWVMAYQEEYHGGVQLATGDIDGDGAADIVVSPYLDGGPNIRVYTLNANNKLELLDWILAYEETYRGTLSMAVGDTDGDGTGEIVTVPLTYGGPDVRVFKYANGDFVSVAGYYAYDANFHGGVNLFVNDVDEDGMAEVMTSPASHGGPNVRVYGLDTGRESLKGWFWAFPEGFRGGVNFGK